MASSIGIKIANGEFYPVIEENSTVKKRLVLTTVHDGQRSVQIDLYKSSARSMADAEYIGSLVVEQIAPRPKGEPSIELVISSDGGDELNAEALDMDTSSSGERQRLSVSMQALEQDRTYEVPDFELEADVVPPSGLYDPEAGSPAAERRAFPMIPVIAAILVALLIIAALLWVVFGRGSRQESTATAAPVVTAPVEPAPEPSPAPAETAKPEVVVEQPAPQEPAAAPVAEEPAPPPEPPVAVSRKRPPAPVKSYKVPRTIPKEGIRYKIRWGDTLWDISEAFYRNPWLYPRIARFNKIRNPDLIISGTYLRVPPKQ